ncbi:HAD family hydrolase [Gloeocapsopsis dulcis]|uniref:Haloacid dehalogenase n=1 Tax=Gloeocapsopsis dulcis AAB1 = 1H9 TaxID=1433147 RepID=A0A6N8G2B2_9CHRO|nr:HAD hydrolase-like protein [Gloeocapsopsis dulcis]MUL39548.1 hypothetical protein [Gloeocapsopsis dulcis AAB1 = 1H9]WNN91703.1 HAD hydrolase-like protein [Gloeocapsopsis dulcis]
MQLVIFDVDGTLTDTNKVDADCFVRAFYEEFSIFYINQNWQEYTHSTDAGITQQIFQKNLGRLPAKEELFRLKKRFIYLLHQAAQNQNLFNAILGATSVISKLQQLDYCIAIATGGWQDSAIFKLQKAGINAINVPIASADDSLSREDIIETVILRAKKWYKTDIFQKAVFIGDGLWDVKAAANLKIPFIGVGNALVNHGVQHTINDFSNYKKLQQLLIEAKPSK